MATYLYGFEEDRFQQAVSQYFNCVICKNVLRDPVMCRDDQHLFCRACINTHLANFERCPSCNQELCVHTLREAPRVVTNVLSELKIRCDYYKRGCPKFVELGDLEKHAKECEFGPAICSNQGCFIDVNRRDLTYHERTVCERRRVEFHNCVELRQEMGTMKQTFTMMNEKLDMAAGNEEMKCDLKEMAKQLERISMQLQHGGGMNTKSKVVVAGGSNVDEVLDSVEMFDLSKQAWTLLQPMNRCRSTASAVVYNNQMIVSGGFDNEDDVLNSLEALENLDEVSPLSTWEAIPAELPQNLFGHQSVVFNDNLIVVGGGGDDDLRFDNISEVSLVPPYTSKLLASMAKKTSAHGMECFDNQLVIVGGGNASTGVDNKVVIYDVSKNECKELAPLPYPVGFMATVKWHDNVIILGGTDGDNKALNKVFIYNVKTRKSHMLPPMLYKRKGCTAVVVGSMIIVMGGLDENIHVLKSVESFNFSRYTWEELPSMHEARAFATFVAC
ncbi:E3 ubiquitin- ligase NRDP1 [Paramuricea clavata]|uniref:E3 ubiquitin- ligase NRDP1 n=1 Tax=Paramuricea clavata TaxID=317549 RepID=A0A6S7IHW9_PARCT|nr:E3 ubiquitin- ligase NRDP1 [Paramuricea clavata]